MAGKKRIVSILFTTVIILAVMPMMTEKSYSESASMHELKINKTYNSYDITGDSKPDKLSINAKEDSGWIGGFAIKLMV